MLFITFHGGKPPKPGPQTGGTAADAESSPTPVNNIYAYDDGGGSPLETKVLQGADALLQNAELRGMVFLDKHLYVLNGRKDANQILRFKGSGTKYEFRNVFASKEGDSGRKGVNSIFHPFAGAFSGKRYFYVSNQDTNVVTRLQCDDRKARTASAAPVAPSLKSRGVYRHGTFVASSEGQLPGLEPTTPEPLPQGLDVQSKFGKVHFSVRDLLVSGELLYVCDEPANMVKVYNADGKLLHFSNQIRRPAHLLADGKRLYVSGGDRVLVARLNKFPLYFTPVPGVAGKNVSGMAFNAKGSHFFTADRKANSVCRYEVHPDGTFGAGVPIIQGMPDHPEFLLYTQD